MADISIAQLSKRYAGKPVLDELSLDVKDGEMLVLLGPSGCGKSTLLRCVAGLERPEAGRIALAGRTVFDAQGGQAVPPYERNVGFVFQSFALWPHMTVAQNVGFPLKVRKLLKSRGSRVAEVLGKVRCGELAERLPSELSGGQQQRVALARALVAEPEVMLLDEPLSNLDALLRLELRHQLREIHRAFGFTGIFVTHDQAEALHVGSRVALMREGRIEQIGAPADIYETPATPYAARFLGVQNLLTLASPQERLWSEGRPLLRPLAPQDEDGLVLGFRARDLAVQAVAETAFGESLLPLGTGRVTDLVYLGDAVECTLQAGDAQLLASLPRSHARLAPGAEVALAVPRESLLLYREGRLAPSPAQASSRLKLA